MQVTDFDTTTLTFGVIYEDHDAGRHPEDGCPLVAQVYFVTATAPDGTRFKRHVGTWSWVSDDVDGYPMAYRSAFAPNGRHLSGIDDAGLADAAAEMAARLEASPTRRLNPEAWEFAGAVYGSDAYQALGIEEETAHFEREAERWG